MLSVLASAGLLAQLLAMLALVCWSAASALLGSAGLLWAGLGWAGLGWAGLGWAGLGVGRWLARRGCCSVGAWAEVGVVEL